jgi:hypothetical protein
LDHIQEKDLTIIGFLVGSSPIAANLEDMQEGHENHPIIHGTKLITKDQDIKLTPEKKRDPLGKTSQSGSHPRWQKPGHRGSRQI